MPLALWSSRQSRRSLALAKPARRNRHRAGLGERLERLEERYALAAQLTTTPITWEVLGLDSNKPLISGPNQYLIGARITNTGTEPVSGVTAAMSFGDTVKLNALNQWAKQATTFISANGPTTSTAYNLAPGQSVDVYFGVQIARDTKAYNTARRYDITATGTATSGTVSDNLNGTHQLFVEKLVSQNRNATQTITITKGGAPVTIAQRGDILTITHTSKSAPGGYEQMTNELTLSNSAFEIIGTPVTLPAILPTGPSSITPGVSTTFSTDGTTREGSANTKFYMDAAGWRSDPGVFTLNPTYRTPTDSQKAGGTQMVTTYQVRVRDAAAFGSYNLTGIIYDYSGSSYHYNSDYGAVGKVLTITDTVVVGDRVWKDNNGNGRQDSGDPGIPGITVELRRASDNALISTTISDVNGNYYFDTADGLTLGTSYYIKFVKPAGTTFVTKDASSATDETDSDADPTTGQTAPFTLTAAASQNLTIDAGLSFTGNTISGSVWVDTNGNGLQDSGEVPGAATVQLYQIVDGQPVLITSTTTTTSGGGAGAYSFTNLPPGDYFIKTIPVSETQGLTNADQGTNDAVDSDFNPFTGDTPIFTLGTGQTVDRDAGLVTGATITGTVWNDANVDGQQGDAAVMPGVTVELLDSAGNVVATTSTGDDGNYTFSLLPPSTGAGYSVRVVKPTGYAFTTANAGADVSDSDVNATTGVTDTFVLSQGGTIDRDAGLYLPPPDAVDDAKSTPLDTPVNVPMLDNDTYALLTNITFTQPPAGQGSVVRNDGGTPDDPTDDTFTYTPPTGFTGIATFTYTITNAEGEPDTATVTITVAGGTPTGDLSITKTDLQETDIPGTSITYTIVVSNAGPNDVTGAAVNDTLPTAILNAAWTAVYSSGSTGPNAGTGSLADVLVSILAGGTATFTVTGTIDPTATGSLLTCPP